MLRLPRLTLGQKIVNDDGTPTIAFQQYIQQFATAIELTVNGIQGALDAAGIALDAAEVAKQAAADATDAAAGSAAATAANAREQALVNSYIEPDSVLTATPTTITIASHNRMYADGTSAAVTGGSVPVTAAGDTDYISYVDPDREGGAVVYSASTTPPVQTGDVHVVGAVTVPATGTADGGEGPRRPGYVAAKFLSEPEP